ncbi:hypothetical protein ACTXP3_27775, partial [Klebsiella pneumoniae]|uniref:hypothetical protein n=1 Tax=Klebsiella pneumoniae TaxID=573 RepID=UPI003FD273BC
LVFISPIFAVQTNSLRPNMKKIILLLSIITGLNAQAQNDPPKPKTKIDLVNRSKDHFMIQFGSDTWTSRPDSVRTG